jgi:hypothetical protein
VELVGGAPVVREEQEAERDLRHEERLREREQVRHEAADAPPAPVDETAHERAERGNRHDEEGQRLVRG